MENVCEFAWSLILRDHTQVWAKKEKLIIVCMSSKQRHIKKFLLLEVQEQQKMYQKCC